MDDAEAEAALLAIGPLLVWHGDALCYCARVVKNGTSARYDVRFRGAADAADATFEAVFWCGEATESHAGRFATCRAAKAACEWHYATGKWDG